MIRIVRLPLGADGAERLARKAEHVRQLGGSVAHARATWKSAAAERGLVRDRLAEMAAGIQRCMYCGDSLGTDIDHFEPLARTPSRAFDWLNHLLACSHCNSNEKRDGHPCGEAGECLLIDPTREEPSTHLRLVLSTGEYQASTPKGGATIETIGLNRPDLVRGRADAFAMRGLVFLGLMAKHDAGDIDAWRVALDALHRQPFADVLAAMMRIADRPGADIVLGADVRDAMLTVVSLMRAEGAPTVHMTSAMGEASTAGALGSSGVQAPRGPSGKT
ncbi:HNH endonuclease [Allonocardiopsis opalescens]|uniref:HNH endonuclease n=1 Tax=Allonocardiopsis opalescens TaxID=1144618 RepID=A0A2T0PZL0_9ACTN|nr:HNH endonuclease [Allonocardiopsis opalescens]PRX96968.1 HNH endonuclease [Allonocardiopsis opalescens]